ncbi:His Kinase A (phospho-acceptor) domain-containing protein [Mariprofundus ferrinatatus]|uniref:histidine kinase n=1 Tax=Mariprofundus ferrinatatus TaxID=1921087 RepID=A0A2K8L5P2_9PROT|nr:ATP-binding protein [Mariprofundus ferrinatatus]ATX82640.1 His Kinase A (phospho-acceptor) domain-containing protein [Mariprofundus ferrinatatus]
MITLYLRVLAGSAIALIIATWFYQDAAELQQQVMVAAGLLFLLLLVMQALLSYSNFTPRNQLMFCYGGDALLAGLLVFSTGGVTSPFAFLSGLIIIASGLHGMRLLPQLTSIIACICYLAAAYAAAWKIHYSLLDAQQSTHALLQVSALLLVGGVMAFISRRHSALRAVSVQAVRQHRQLKDLYDRVMLSMHEGMVVLDEDRHLSDMNAAARRLLGSLQLEELLSMPDLNRYFERPHAPTCQFDYKHNDKIILVRVTRLDAGHDAMWLLTLVDISDVRKMEQELVQQEKMAALGQMAAMLAHEIRNPIQTMTQGLEFIDKGKKSDGINIKHILHDEMLRLNRLASTMLDYAKPMVPAPESVDISELIAAAVAQYEMTGSSRILWSCDIDQINLDPDHFRVVLDNLLSNALANSSKGAVRIDMHAETGVWKLKVCNPGKVPENIRGRIFEPFVSGRSSGVGLGLATVQQVCRVNGWRVDINCLKESTCFTVTGEIGTAKNSDGKLAAAGENNG